MIFYLYYQPLFIFNRHYYYSYIITSSLNSKEGNGIHYFYSYSIMDFYIYSSLMVSIIIIHYSLTSLFN